jgi:hypothetical protein
MNTLYKSKLIVVMSFASVLLFCTAVFAAESSDWKSKDVNWLAGPGGRIKSIRYPQDKESLLTTGTASKVYSAPSLKGEAGLFNILSGAVIPLPDSNNIIHNPPVSGFVPNVVITVTDERSDEDDFAAHTESSVAGNFVTDNPYRNFIIGLFDTGSSAHLISYADANSTGLFSSNLVTENPIGLQGATGTLYAWVSHPFALFVDGLGAIDPNAFIYHKTEPNASDPNLTDPNVPDPNIPYPNMKDPNATFTAMVGQSNVSVVVGDIPGPNQPDLPTVIGSPFSVNYVTAIFNERQLKMTRRNIDYNSPDLQFYEEWDTNIPDYQDSIPLNLLPEGGIDVEYFPDIFSDLDFEPLMPSTIVGGILGFPIQSLFFVNSVDLYEGTKSAIDKSHFMLDTGAQVTVLGRNVATRLGLKLNKPDFEVEIQDVTGATTFQPGFFLDSIEIPTTGEWLTFFNVPVIVLNVASPEGGYLDGIIGTNLFMEFNLVLHGGGLNGQDAPYLAFERVRHLRADIAPQGGDGIVNFIDLATFMKAWQSTPDSPNWNPQADLYPPSRGDNVIDFNDLVEFLNQWLDTLQP